MQLEPVRASHRQTNYKPALPLDPPKALPLPPLTDQVDEAIEQLAEYGLCILTDVLSEQELHSLREKLDSQAEAERRLGDLAPPGANSDKQSVSNLVNKGREFLDLIERNETDSLAGFMLGKHFLISSITGSMYRAPVSVPQQLHRDQGYVPATVDFPAACNLIWVLDEFTPQNGGTCVVPGSHRWPAEFQVRPPPRDWTVQISAPAGSIFAWDGRVWHGFGTSQTGEPRRSVITYFCLPWVRQQENWGVSCLQEVLDEASPKIRRRLGLRTYGSLGGVSGTPTGKEGSRPPLGNYDVDFPEYVIGESASLHKLRRVTRQD